MAKPTPCEPPEREKIAVLMPTRRAGHVDQRAAGVAGIDRGVGLDEELIVGDADLRARHRRDDAVGHGLADAERIADRQHHVADLQIVGIAEVDHREALLAVVLDAQHREIGARVLEHDIDRELALVGERDLHLVGAVDDVIVGDDQAGRIDDDAGAERLLGLLARPAELRPEEAAEERVFHQRIAVRHGLGGRDGDDRRHHALDDRRVGHAQRFGRGRHHAVLRGRALRQQQRASAASADSSVRRSGMVDGSQSMEPEI